MTFRTAAILAIGLLAGSAVAAAAQAPAPAPARTRPPAVNNRICKPATETRAPGAPIGGGPGLANDFSRPATVAAIDGVVAAGVTWTKLWQQGGNSADGIVHDRTGAMLLAQEDYDQAISVSPTGKVATAFADVWGLSSLSADDKGRLYGVTRTERVGSPKPHADKVTNSIVQLTPTRKVVTDRWADGTALTVRPNDLAADGTGGAYFTSGCLYYADAKGARVAAPNLTTNGIVLSLDGKTLYTTNGPDIVAFDVSRPGVLANRRTFGEMPVTDSGDGLAVDSAGRIYVTTVASPMPGVHVFDKAGKYLGLIPTPRPVISLAFGGPGNRTLFVVGSGADDEQGKLIHVGVQQTAATLYSLPMIASGPTVRAK